MSGQLLVLEGRAKERARELYLAYMKGWRDGAWSQSNWAATFAERLTRPDLKKAYLEGVNDGSLKRREAQGRAQEEYGWSPTILRGAL